MVLRCQMSGFPSRGLGDTLAKATRATGIAGIVHSVTKAIGFDCGCLERQQLLNATVPFFAGLPAAPPR